MSSQRPCPAGCIAKKPCPQGKVPAVICRSKTSPKRNPWKKNEVARLHKAIEDIQPELKEYYGKLDEFMRLSTKQPDPDKLDFAKFGEIYRHHVKGHMWGKGILPNTMYTIVQEMIKKENVSSFPSPSDRYNSIAGSMRHARELKTVITVKEAVYQLCLLHWKK